MHILFRTLTLPLLILAFCLSGCGGGPIPTYPVNGKVLFEDGTSPQFGTVEFLNDEHQLNARGEIAKDGTFTVSTFQDEDGAVEGTHRIAIIQLTMSPDTAQYSYLINHDHGDVVNPRFHDFRTSGLIREISPGQNQLTLTVSKKAEK